MAGIFVIKTVPEISDVEGISDDDFSVCLISSLKVPGSRLTQYAFKCGTGVKNRRK
jgi:uncharacterized Zn ribbon protein